MLLLITIIEVVYSIDCKRVICGMFRRGNKPKAGLFFTNV